MEDIGEEGDSVMQHNQYLGCDDRDGEDYDDDDVFIDPIFTVRF